MTPAARRSGRMRYVNVLAESVVALGQGAYGIAQYPAKRAEEIKALRAGVDFGMTVIDTAEAYGDGESERLIAEAVGDRRDDLFIVSKVKPVNATTGRGVTQACEASLRRLDTDRLDLYLLHWRRDNEPLSPDVFDAFQKLVSDGKTRYWGVSNFALSDMQELAAIGFTPAANQVLYNLRRRGIEHDLLPWCQREGVMVMAYSPIEQGVITTDPVLTNVGARHGATAAQVALAWLLARDVMVIPKAGTVAHVTENRASANLQLTVDDLQELEASFARPATPVPFDML
jgi:diketogulonate reductase-like aldo/keto reductase